MFSSVKDDNFCFPIPDVLETAKLKLVPFIPALHAEAIINSTDKDTWHYIPFGPFSSAQEFIESFYEGWIRLCPEIIWFQLFVLVLPQARHTHVASHMIGLLMRYALNLPAEGGLGLRRVQWSANVKNEGSIGLARKMGMRIEGVKRWARVLKVEKAEGSNGIATRKGDPREECPGRDTVTLAICWDEWEDEGKEQVKQILAM
ncbi:hypothetical protein DFJ43DRAFT_1135253 [Lentinula guzmanii]|uniref:N-acetyltransferase domain-containing protein n=2 Tax=Lentinula TaxID=5352 RepID=A0AA38J105_9AGAR|nr:hypothetical protein DFJ43DRAFT_1135253 [Lentinula guzmanii]KAJ3779787.1 hypothetical protein GGU10DRAFT_397917 [Lentinula aff. detonsa]KAJ3791876.1 hypothetical protein GGU11DRAFT_819147 [Lentinula aff. detonsa]